MVHRRPYSCALCSKRFDREDQLKKHLFAHPQSHVGGLAAEPPAPGVDSPSPRHSDHDRPTENADAPSPSKSPRLHQQQAHVVPGITPVPDVTYNMFGGTLSLTQSRVTSSMSHYCRRL